MQNLKLIRFTIILLFLIHCGQKPAIRTIENPEKHPQHSAISAASHTIINLKHLMDSLRANPASVRILIDKSDYTLSVILGHKLLKIYPVVFGHDENGDKLMQGDRLTPEGDFKIVNKYKHPKWSRFIWLNYPNASSYKKHALAKRNGKIPPNAKIGGEVGIHGVPEGKDHYIDDKFNWTLGCISLKNKDIEELYPFINKKTVITIQK